MNLLKSIGITILGCLASVGFIAIVLGLTDLPSPYGFIALGIILFVCLVASVHSFRSGN